MTEDVSTGVDAVPVPAIIAIGDRDQVERAAALREVFAHCLPHATFRVLEGIEHLSPLEAPDALVDICTGLLDASEQAAPIDGSPVPPLLRRPSAPR